MKERPQPPRALLLVVLLILAAGAIYVVTTLGDDDEEPAVVTVKVDTLDRSPDPDKTIIVPKVAVDQAADALSGYIQDAPLSGEDADHTGKRDETPAGTVGPALAANQRALAANRRTTEALPTAGASGGIPGCTTSFVRNQSSRRGVRPTIQVLHYTVSPNRPGRSDINGIIAFFNRSSSQASSHFVIDAEGNCAYIVPIEAKSWTQAGGNPYAVSYEIIATGRESSYLGSAGYAKLRSVMREVAKRTGIPVRAGRISGCAPSRPGIVQHANGGTCWGGHHDIGPFGFGAVVAKITAGGAPVAGARNAAATYKLGVLTRGERSNVTCLLRERRLEARRGGWSKVAASHLQRARRCKRDLEARNAALHRAGLTTASRRARHAVIHAVL